MTIVHFVVSNSFGGVENHICTLIKLMRFKDYQFKIVCHESVKEQFQKQLEGFDVDIFSLKLWPVPRFTVYRKLIKLFRQLSPDIVHCHLYSATRIGAVAAKIGGAQIVVETIHLEEVWRRGFKKFLYCTLDAIIGRLFVDHYVAVSNAVSRYYQKNKAVSHRKITLIYNTTIHEDIKISSKEFSYRIGFLGRLSEQKGIDILIEAMSLILKEDNRFQLYIGGTGPLLPDLRHQIEERGIEEAVNFLGYVTDKNKFFGTTDIFVLPSRNEGFPLVLLEAGVYQMPVVATKVSGNPEIISHEETGILVQSENPKELALGIMKYKNSKVREAYSTKLKELVESKFSANRYVERMDAFYSQFKNKINL